MFPKRIPNSAFHFSNMCSPTITGCGKKGVCVSAAGESESVGGRSPAGCKACNLSGGLVWDNHRTGHGMEINVE